MPFLFHSNTAFLLWLVQLPFNSFPFFPLFPWQVLYKEEFEKNKGKGFSVVADTPEMQRIKKTQDNISNVSPDVGMLPAYHRKMSCVSNINVVFSLR